jgi:two-component system KDP operon response regulator KdpE
MRQSAARPAQGPTRVLIVVDVPVVAETVRLTLDHGTYATRHAMTASEASELVGSWRPHLAVIDMDLGDQALLSELGVSPDPLSTSIPVLALTRRGDLKTKLEAFDQGVDDIMTVPFSPEELLARMLALTRRAYGEPGRLLPVLKLGEIEIDILNREVRAGESVLHLTALEQSLLYVLAAHAGRVLTRTELLDAVWGVDFIAESNVVDRHIRSLRAKLQNSWRQPRFIATVPGRGYRFVPVFSDPTTGAPSEAEEPQAAVTARQGE